jgi:hypothetical protein
MKKPSYWLAGALALAGCTTERGNASAAGGNRAAPAGNAAASANVARPAGNEAAAPAPSVEGQVLRLHPDGLATASVGLHSSGLIRFGQARDEVVAAVTGFRGRPTGTGRNSECGAGPMEQVDFGPLRLNFQDARFVGWELRGRADPPIEEEYGLAIGTPRADLEESDQGAATFENSSLGVEFDAGGIGGLMSGGGRDATVASLYAGTTCFFR